MYWVNSVLWQLRIGKIIAKFPAFSRFGFWPNFPVMQRLFLFFFCWRGSFFHRNVSLDFNFLPKRYLQNVTALTIVRQCFFILKLYLLILMPLCTYTKPTNNEYDTFSVMSFVNSFISEKRRLLRKKCLKVFACSKSRSNKNWTKSIILIPYCLKVFSLTRNSFLFSSENLNSSRNFGL